MTNFYRMEMTIASTRGDNFHHVGFDVQREEWPKIRQALLDRDTSKSLTFREETSPRDCSLGKKWKWVWVVMNDQTPLSVLMALMMAAGEPAAIKFRPNEYP